MGERPVSEQEQSAEKAEELRIMKERILRSLEDEETRAKVADDFSHTFKQLSLLPAQAEELCGDVFALLRSEKPLPDIESEILRIFGNIKVKMGGKEQNLIEMLDKKLKDRARIIVSQVSPHLVGVKGSTNVTRPVGIGHRGR